MKKVILIGGSSSTGKSYLAKQLAEKYRMSLIEIDDIRIALQSKLKPADFPNLFFFVENKNYLTDNSVEFLLSKLESVGVEIWPALNSLIDKHIACNEPVIFEGDGIIPKLAASRNQENIQSIFIYDDKENILQKELKRQRGGVNPNLEKQVEFSHQHGQMIKSQAESLGLITISASPQETLFERTIKLLEN